MSTENREDRALDALIASAFLSRPAEDPLVTPDDPASYLTEEERDALKAMGEGLVERLLAGNFVKRDEATREAHEALTAMNRGGNDDLPAEVREEMERKIRELGEMEDDVGDRARD